MWRPSERPSRRYEIPWNPSYFFYSTFVKTLKEIIRNKKNNIYWNGNIKSWRDNELIRQNTETRLHKISFFSVHENTSFFIDIVLFQSFFAFLLPFCLPFLNHVGFWIIFFTYKQHKNKNKFRRRIDRLISWSLYKLYIYHQVFNFICPGYDDLSACIYFFY